MLQPKIIALYLALGGRLLCACASDTDGPRAFAGDVENEATAATTDTATDTATALADALPDPETVVTGTASDTAVDEPSDTTVTSETEDTRASDTADPPDTALPPATVRYDFPHFTDVLEAIRGEKTVWANFAYVTYDDGAPVMWSADYDGTAAENDFWPASAIKVYTAIAALVLLAEYDLSLDAEATFYHRAGGSWVEDTTRSVREFIHGSVNCSSNSDYTLALRLAGIDWLNTEFLTPDRGFAETALMVGYVDSRPHRYIQDEDQRIVLVDGAKTVTREHSWSGHSYSNDVGCVVYNGDSIANCSSPRDMTTHMARLVQHELLPEAQRFALRQSDLDWFLYDALDNTATCGGAGWEGVQRVFPDADFFRKGGLVADYKIDLHYVRDQASGTEYVAAIALDDTGGSTMARMCEATARMALTPDRYVHLESLVDHVNPVVADVMVYSAYAGEVELVIKDFAEDPDSEDGWTALPGTQMPVAPGVSWLALESTCLDFEATVHVRARITVPGRDDVRGLSDLHYVIVEGACATP